MALSEVSICNDALAMLGQEPFITSLSQSGKVAGLCNVFYERSRDELLRSHPWNFAMRRVELAALTDAPVWGYDYAYELPADCLRVWQLDLSHPTRPWKVEGRTIVTDQSAPLNLLYIAQVTDVAQFDASFSRALAARIAVDLAMPLTNSAAMADQMARRADMLARMARGNDATEGQPDVPWADVLVEARR